MIRATAWDHQLSRSWSFRAIGDVSTTNSMSPERAGKLLSIIVIFWSHRDIVSGSPQLEPMRTMTLRYWKVAGTALRQTQLRSSELT
jgi:hypothetical protein